MTPTPAQVALTAVHHSIALLTLDLGVMDPDAPLTTLGERVHRLQRALSRIEVLTAMHPDLTLADCLPPGAMPDDELAQVLADETELARLVEYRPAPTTVTLSVRGVASQAPQDVRDIAALLAGVVVEVTPAGTGPDDGAYVADIGSVLTHAVLTATTDDWAFDAVELERLKRADAEPDLEPDLEESPW